MKEETINFVLAKLLPQTWKREATKQSLDMIHDSKFDQMYQNMCQEKNVPCQQKFEPLPMEKLMPKNLFDYVKVKITLPPQPELHPKNNHQNNLEVQNGSRRRPGPGGEVKATNLDQA